MAVHLHPESGENCPLFLVNISVIVIYIVIAVCHTVDGTLTVRNQKKVVAAAAAP
eukprot:SAG11_NODE_5738_length_1474_cov_1.432000_1_plen_54_part_10